MSVLIIGVVIGIVFGLMTPWFWRLWRDWRIFRTFDMNPRQIDVWMMMVSTHRTRYHTGPWPPYEIRFKYALMTMMMPFNIIVPLTKGLISLDLAIEMTNAYGEKTIQEFNQAAAKLGIPGIEEE